MHQGVIYGPDLPVRLKPGHDSHAIKSNHDASLAYEGFSASPTLREGSTPTPVHYLRRVLLSHALIPIREEDVRTSAMHEHGHDRLREMLNANKAS